MAWRLTLIETECAEELVYVNVALSLIETYHDADEMCATS